MLAAETRAFLITQTGQEPENEALWLEALTHGSTGEKRDYERLEFLGDRVLGLAIAEWLHELSDAAEGRLSQRLNALVSRATCAAMAREIGLGPHIRLGKQARDDGGQDSDNILGDVMESLIGACFLERGWDAARAMVRRLWTGAVEGKTGNRKHPKSALQEWAAGNKRRMPEYRLVDRSGPDHASRFTVEVAVHGVGEAQATSNSKQDAETQAAEEFLRRFA
ncbi:ribonuclease III [Novosphingobium album (ex Liu et al. 2023)]|uniref:Ribonuclease 3 n=1 Tax=Novosphingobium album (ex Liu et al. 2023) TaxID=3031130 RepID=A0ABT5WWZ4_9SPHN|nr:ribonuclease III [Novosphingobium album (ex Liu et al. 2023)]MDE8654382.1 ribonuclease III [Novosphingobium album (ex Liu et al. 2023)]